MARSRWSLESAQENEVLDDSSTENSMNSCCLSSVVTLDGRDIDAQFQRDGARTIIRFPEGIDIAAGQTLQVQHV